MGMLLITCDESPVPPLKAHYRKIYEVIRALSGEMELAVLCYPKNDEEAERLREHWSEHSIRWHFLDRRVRGRHLRSIFQRTLLSTSTRNFELEEKWVRDSVGERSDCRLLIDFITGAPLLSRFQEGTILSGHDCMSYLFLQEARSADRVLSKLHFLVRREFARNTERKFAHLAEWVHVVSEQDANELKLINPKVRSKVIPLGSESPPSAQLLPFSQRSKRIIWGNLGSELIRDGLRSVLAAASATGNRPLSGWMVIGGVDAGLAMRQVPEIAEAGCEYHPRVDNISELLGQARYLLLPDIGGTGQKTRAIDGLAHGCCVIGLPEVFRGIATEETPMCVTAPDYSCLIDRIVGLTEADSMERAAAGKRYFEEHLSAPMLKKQWLSLIDGCRYLQP